MPKTKSLKSESYRSIYRRFARCCFSSARHSFRTPLPVEQRFTFGTGMMSVRPISICTCHLFAHIYVLDRCPSKMRSSKFVKLPKMVSLFPHRCWYFANNSQSADYIIAELKPPQYPKELRGFQGHFRTERSSSPFTFNVDEFIRRYGSALHQGGS